MTVDIRINGALIAQADVTNETGGTQADDVNTYRWTYQGENGQQLEDTLQHRYGDGVVLLADKVIEHIARRYRLVGCYTRPAQPLPEPVHCCTHIRGHDGPCEPPL